MRWARPLLAYLTAAVVTTWPLVLHPSALLGAPSGPGDPFLNLWILGWDLQAIISHPTSIFTGQVFNANIFYPASGTLAYSDHLLLQSVLLAPIYAATHDVVLCYNVLLVASLVASAMAMHVFVRSIAGTEGGAYLAGLAWGFGSYRFAHLIHLQLQAMYFLPLTMLFLHRVVAGRRRRDLIMLGVLAALQAVSSVYYGVIGGVALAVGAVGLAVGVGRWRSSALAGRLISSALIAAVLVAPVAVVYWRVAQREGFGRNLYEAGRNAAYASSYLQVPPGNVVYGWTDLLRQRDVPGTPAPPRTGPERELFPGFVLFAMAIAGAWLGWKSDVRPTVLAAIAITLSGFVLSLGPEGLRPLYAALYQFVFGFSVIRAPARFAVLVVFGMCVLAAIAWRELSTGAHGARVRVPGRARAILTIVMIAAVAEYVHVPRALTTAPALHTDVGQWLSHEPAQGAVAVLPLDLDIASTPAMVQSLEYLRPIVNGYSGQRPAYYVPLVEAINTFPSDDALIALRDGGVRFVVTRTPIASADPPIVERARFGDGTIYELEWTPEVEARLASSSRVEPPPAGTIPFNLGEVARYRVVWGGAGMNLSAGEIAISIEPPVYRFIVRAETAPWVAKFFDAHDLFTTQADAGLLPQVHEREQKEGARHVARAFVYDREEGVVRIAPSLSDARSPGAVVLPMVPNARDAIAALFYVRTLPLREGERYRFPVNEAGRNVVLDLAVDGRESLRVGEQDMPAVRLTPRLERSVDNAAQPSVTMWLSDDSHRVPLAVDVDAGFGHVRLELVRYEPGKP